MVELADWSLYGEQIWELRQAAWQDEEGSQALPESFFGSDFDSAPNCSHLCFFACEQIVGAVRASIHDEFEELPFAADFENVRCDMPVGATGRLVVHPCHRGVGIARALERAAVEFLLERSCRQAFGLVRSSTQRRDALIRQGYQQLQEVESLFYDGSMRKTWLLVKRLGE